MEKNNYWKLVWAAAFVAFAAVSCWATSESLHLLLPTWPAVMCWIVTIGFFIIASLGTKMIVDSLNSNIYLEKRGTYLTGGIVLVIVFWLCCSMPTNTHTFFYRTVIRDKVSSDISTTRGYLGQIKNNTNNKIQADIKIQELRNKVDILLGELEAEIRNEANPGQGPKSKEILRKLAVALGVDKIEPLSFKSKSVQQLNQLCDAYRTKIYLLANSKVANIKNDILTPNPDNLSEAENTDKNLALLQKYISEGTIDLNNPEDMVGENGVCDRLNFAYNVVKKNNSFVNFSSKADEDTYTANSPITKVKQMISVFDVWKDFLKEEYTGHGFAFWIIISVLVDIAAFVFFDLAFRKQED